MVLYIYTCAYACISCIIHSEIKKTLSKMISHKINIQNQEIFTSS